MVDSITENNIFSSLRIDTYVLKIRKLKIVSVYHLLQFNQLPLLFLLINFQLNGINTQGENIADNGGLKEAYAAYKKWVWRHETEPKLPGLKYTPEQMFWISAANTWCSKYRPESLKLRILTGYHSPGQFRVWGPMSNSEDFSKDFACPIGSRMNPEKKCKVW